MKKIIVLNDLKKFLMKKADILLKKNARIFSAASAEEILSIHKKIRGDLIILDIDMQGTPGDKLSAAIKENHRLRTVAIIIACAKKKSEMERCHACGANAIITKPVNPEDLFCRVMDVLNLSERENLRGIVKVAVKGKFLTDFFFAISQNVSVSGLLFETEKVFDRGDTITCSLVLKNKITVDGEVVRVVKKKKDLFHYGIRFLDLDPESKARIEEFVNGKERR